MANSSQWIPNLQSSGVISKAEAPIAFGVEGKYGSAKKSNEGLLMLRHPTKN